MRKAIHKFGAALLGATALSVAAAEVHLERVPEGGLQPSALIDNLGTAHVVYLIGDAQACDIHYVRRATGETNWSKPVRVNSQLGSAVAVGAICGPQIALGRNARVHICWNGSTQSASTGGSPLFYTRSNDSGSPFEPQRNVMTSTRHLDGGGSVGADLDGRVFLVWHANAENSPKEETARAVFVATSKDDGKTFTPEKPVSPPGSGACECCGLKAFAEPHGDVFVAFRSASSAMKRDMMLLHSRDHGQSFVPVFTHPWNVGVCPMTTASLATGKNGTWAAWETSGKIFGIQLGLAESRAFELTSNSGKHPRTATNLRGETLAVWTEGAGLQRGGMVGWQIFDGDARPLEQRGRQDGIPAWSYAAPYATLAGDFVVLY